MEDGEWNFRRHARFHLPSSICHLRILLFLALAVFLAGCTPPGPRALLAGKKASGSRRLRRRGGAIEDRHDAAGHERAGVELLRRRAATRRPAGGRREGVSKRADVRPRPDGGALQSRLPLAGAKQTRRRRRRSSPPTRCGATTRRKAGSSSARRNSSCATCATAEKSFSTALSLNPNNAEALNGLGLARVARQPAAGRGEVFRRRRGGASRITRPRC